MEGGRKKPREESSFRVDLTRKDCEFLVDYRKDCALLGERLCYWDFVCIRYRRINTDTRK